MRSMSQFLDYFRSQRIATRTLVASIPDEHFEWRPAPDTFSCGDIVRHLMQAEIFWRKLLLSAVRGEPFDPFGLPGSGDERLKAFRGPNLRASGNPKYGTSAQACLAGWREIQEKTEQELGAIPADALEATEVVHPLLGLPAPLWRMLLEMVNHEVHHRGQLSAYLKMVGAEQPAILLQS